MQFCFITFRSVTPAQRAEQLLKRSGFSCALRRTPRWMERQGCSYGLQLPLTDIQRCVQLLKQGGISYRKVYLLGEKEQAEEMEL